MDFVCYFYMLFRVQLANIILFALNDIICTRLLAFEYTVWLQSTLLSELFIFGLVDFSKFNLNSTKLPFVWQIIKISPNLFLYYSFFAYSWAVKSAGCTCKCHVFKLFSIISVKAKSFADREIRYTLKAQGQGAAGTFNIGPTSGIVKLAKELDFEDLRQPHIYSLIVTATEDSGGFSTSVEVTGFMFLKLSCFREK